MSKRKSSSRAKDEPPRTKKRGNTLVKDANELSPNDFKSRHIRSAHLTFGPARLAGQGDGGASHEYRIDFNTAEGAGSAVLLEAFDLIESTQRDHYSDSSIGWHPRRKRAEMQEETMRYLLVRQQTESDAPTPLLGYLSFMLTFDSIPSVPVLYIYELHIEWRSAGKSLGSHLMYMAEDIARTVGVDLVMLTCFVSNDKAKKFYERCGYVKDVCSPDDRVVRKKIVKADYWIMSKRMNSSEQSVDTTMSATTENDGAG